MNIVLISSYRRPLLLQQTIESLIMNAADWKAHHLTVVYDQRDDEDTPQLYNAVTILLTEQGASAARNIGAGSIPRYRRQDHVLFLDDDVYLCNNWDARLDSLARYLPYNIVSGYSHPFNHCDPRRVVVPESAADVLAGKISPVVGHYDWGEPLVVSSVAMMMPWKIFDEVGPWDEPGGPGSSEDYAISMRAKDRGYGFAVTDPQCVIHTGLMSSGGTAIAGYKELCEQNDKLLDFWNIRGRVTFQ